MSARTRTQVTFHSNGSDSSSSISSDLETTDFEETIDALINKIHRSQPSSQVVKPVSEEKRNKKRYENLLIKIKRDKITIEQLRAENRALKEEITRCENKIKNFPRMKQKYDRLSDSLSKSAEAYSTIMTLSPKKRTFS